MPFLKRISILNFLQHIVYSNLWIGIGAACFTFNYYTLTNTEPNYSVLGFVLFSTIFIYGFQRLLKIHFKINIHGDRVLWMNKHKISVFSILGLSIITSFILFLEFWKEALWIFLISAFFSFFYVWKVPGLRGKNLRDIPGAKIYIIAVIWVLVCGLLPAIISQNPININLLLICLSHFLFMVAITIPFDIRDITLDDQSKQTIPQIIGEKKSVYLSILLLICSQVILMINQANLGTIVFIILSIFVLYNAKSNRHDMYFSALTDGLLILQPILLWLFYI